MPMMWAGGGALAAAVFIRFGVANLYRQPGATTGGLIMDGIAFGLLCAAHYGFMYVGRPGPLEPSRQE